MEMTIVGMELMNHQNIVKVTDALALETCSLATMETVYQEFIFAMATTIAWITAMKIIDMNAVSVTSELISQY